MSYLFNTYKEAMVMVTTTQFDGRLPAFDKLCAITRAQEALANLLKDLHAQYDRLEKQGDDLTMDMTEGCNPSTDTPDFY
jgi:hypothetical protein